VFSGETSWKRDGKIFPFDERRSILSSKILRCTFLLRSLYFAPIGLFNKSLINQFFLLMLLISMFPLKKKTC